MRQPSHIEVADIFHKYGDSYRQARELPLYQLRAMRSIEICRTKELGGHIDKCDKCGEEKISYNSCRNRHCPKCQFLKKEKWILARTEDLLPINYFHVVFTIPCEINPLALRNQKIIYNILFRASKETLLELAKDPKHMGAEIGMIGILHTWGQTIIDHPHMHFITTGGGLSPDGKTWINSRKAFFISIKVISRLFRGKFLDYLKKSFYSGELKFPGNISTLQNEKTFKEYLKPLYNKKWIIYSKPPFKNPETVIEYLGRYTHRVAISNNRIIKIENDKVTFSWKDYADNNKRKEMELDAAEFIRRFLLHILPDKFVKIRYYGFLGNRNHKTIFEKCRELLETKIDKSEIKKENESTWQELLLDLTGFDVTICPFCKKGKMFHKEKLLPERCCSP